jgi:hypothetical protein
MRDLKMRRHGKERRIGKMAGSAQTCGFRVERPRRDGAL